MSTINILITGTKSGIGHGLLSALVARENTTVIAAIRDAPDSQKAKDMVASVPKVGSGSRVIPLQYDASSTTSGPDLIEALKASYPEIDHLDTVVANAGVNPQWGPAREATVEQFNTAIAINTIGPITLYQATRELLLATKGTPKFFVISTAVASITSTKHIPFQTVAYGLSKTAVNHFAHKADLEEERIVIIPIHPGWVQTEMGNAAASALEMSGAPLSLQDSVKGLLKIFDTTTKEDGGKFLRADRDEIESMPW